MVRAVTSFGRSGLSDWFVQRVTAVILLAYTLFLVAFLLTQGELQYEAWKSLFENTFMRIFSLAALLSLGAHAWIGLWSVSTDYMTERLMGSKGTVLRILFQCGYSLVLFGYVVWGVQIIWGV